MPPTPPSVAHEPSRPHQRLLDTRHHVETPEGIDLVLRPAGALPRVLAFTIDLLIRGAILLLLFIVLAFLGRLGMGLGSILLFLVNWWYMVLFEVLHQGRSPGKQVMGLRVVHDDGTPVGWGASLTRNLLRFVDMLPFFYLAGGVACAISRRAQRLGDLAANTIVIRIPKVTEPNLEQLMAGKFNSLRAHPHLEARLRQRVSAQEAALALQALVRRDLLDPVARVELFSQIAEHFRAKVPFPPETTEGITDEQYVRNIVDSLYRPMRATTRGPAEHAKAEPLATT